MNERPDSLPTIHRPQNPTVAESFIVALNTSIQWLDCATEEEYPLALRQLWREQAATAFDAAMNCCDTEVDFGGAERGLLIDQLLGRAQDLWGKTLWLDVVAS